MAPRSCLHVAALHTANQDRDQRNNEMPKLTITLEQEVHEDLANTLKDQLKYYRELEEGTKAANIMRIAMSIQAKRGNSIILPLSFAGFAAAAMMTKSQDSMVFTVDGVVIDKFGGEGVKAPTTTDSDGTFAA